MMLSALPQKRQAGWYFFKMILSSSVKISIESLFESSITLRSSIGTTKRPRESIFLTIPVDFIALFPFFMIFYNLIRVYSTINV